MVKNVFLLWKLLENYEKKTKTFLEKNKSLSHQTVAFRIQKLSINIKDQFFQHLENFKLFD